MFKQGCFEITPRIFPRSVSAGSQLPRDTSVPSSGLPATKEPHSLGRILSPTAHFFLEEKAARPEDPQHPGDRCTPLGTPRR